MPGKKEGALRHFEGWEVGALAVVVALLGTLLVVPLKVAPEDLPLPVVDAKALAASRAREAAQAAAILPELERDVTGPAQGRGLYDLRAFGEELRAYGRHEAAHESSSVVRDRRKLIEAAGRARFLGDEKLLAIRAYQMQLFVAEVRRWQSTGKPTDELAGLGGPFLELLERNGWVEKGRDLLLDDVMLGILFKRRWNEVTGLTDAPFASTLDEERTFYSFLLTHPVVPATAGPSRKDRCRAVDQWRMRKIEDLARLDPSYPLLLSRGVLLARLGDHQAAVQIFREYLAKGDGRYALRARNYLAASVALAGEQAE
jgi:hypothetical protein